MTERIRTPALAPPPIRPAVPRADDPSAFLEAHYRHVWQTRMHDLPFVNAALTVEAIGFARHEGDWLGVVITPWFLNLLLVSGGGQLWGDIPAGERRYLNLPCGTMQFIADDDPDIGPYQYCPLIAPVDQLPDMATARLVAADAIKTVFGPPASLAETPPAPVAEEKTEVSRRGFFRRLAGKRN
ncbi:[NiFe]-hydrogenase assembly chaperone HybE [Dechloromonas sp. XY25]|uniref:[NiFe]-hydrogenase assembly chaperone HybE n=1 Tax=Dechloromonas hankyongensis TaxID=2908002 RepID=A0ABS9JXM1_9RHOO|nr:[NiFe]-hydrogenase assembly chaperone HybE [Dechloromonas hankyongensis]MCG2575574.1 [NiFe]-hydrogenase assembly chaperone HybE [Dechloromonas hankyongensis]